MIADSINSLLWALVMLVIIMYAARESYGFTLLSKGEILPRHLYNGLIDRAFWSSHAPSRNNFWLAIRIGGSWNGV